MRVKLIRYDRTFNTGDYNSVKLSCEVELDVNDNPHVALEKARQFVVKSFAMQMKQEGRNDVLGQQGIS